MNRKYILISVFLVLISSLMRVSLYARQKPDFSYFVTPYIFSKSHLYFKNSNRYTENYTGFGIKAGYLLNSFIIISVFAEEGGLSAVHKSVDSDYDSDFPGNSELTRDLYSLGGQIEFYFFSNPENMFYAGIGIEHLMLKEITYQEVLYPKSRNSFSMLQVSLGNRFLLFPSVLMSFELSFSSNFNQIQSPFNSNSQFSNYVITLKMAFGTYF